jgi:hypothetical protein
VPHSYCRILKLNCTVFPCGACVVNYMQKNAWFDPPSSISQCTSSKKKHTQFCKNTVPLWLSFKFEPNLHFSLFILFGARSSHAKRMIWARDSDAPTSLSKLKSDGNYQETDQIAQIFLLIINITYNIYCVLIIYLWGKRSHLKRRRPAFLEDLNKLTVQYSVRDK